MAINIRATLDRDEADIQVVSETYSGMRYFKPLSDSAMEWMEENLSGENSLLNGELVVESRYADDSGGPRDRREDLLRAAMDGQPARNVRRMSRADRRGSAGQADSYLRAGVLVRQPDV